MQRLLCFTQENEKFKHTYLDEEYSFIYPDCSLSNLEFVVCVNRNIINITMNQHRYLRRGKICLEKPISQMKKVLLIRYVRNLKNATSTLDQKIRVKKLSRWYLNFSCNSVKEVSYNGYFCSS